MIERSISVLVVVRDGERYLGQALHSAVAQSVAPLEVIVIDDGSRDATPRLAAGFGEPVRVVSQPPSGIGAARNTAIANASGELVAFLDADDLWPPKSLAARLEAFATDPAPDLVWGRVRQFANSNLPPDRAVRRHGTADACPGHLPGGMLASRAAFDRVGPFTEGLRVGEFIDWVARAREARLREAEVAEVVLHRRVHERNHTRRHRDDLVDLTRVLRSALHRRSADAASNP
jgi:glycosyltransferase involved in cell wall biosynthesis